VFIVNIPGHHGEEVKKKEDEEGKRGRNAQSKQENLSDAPKT
jgi:hypothetical protein